MSNNAVAHCTPLFRTRQFCRCSRQARALPLPACILIAPLQVGAGLTYQLFTMRYDPRVAYDSNFSLRRQFDQTALFGIQMEITD